MSRVRFPDHNVCLAVGSDVEETLEWAFDSRLSPRNRFHFSLVENGGVPYACDPLVSPFSALIKVGEYTQELSHGVLYSCDICINQISEDLWLLDTDAINEMVNAGEAVDLKEVPECQYLNRTFAVLESCVKRFAEVVSQKREGLNDFIDWLESADDEVFKRSFSYWDNQVCEYQGKGWSAS